MGQSERETVGALIVLIFLQGIMLSALFAGIEPHPPQATPLFGMAPFLGASISIALAAVILGPLATRWGRNLSASAALLALVSYGPQKYLDAQIALIWPSVVLGQAAAIVVFLRVMTSVRIGDGNNDLTKP